MYFNAISKCCTSLTCLLLAKIYNSLKKCTAPRHAGPCYSAQAKLIKCFTFTRNTNGVA